MADQNQQPPPYDVNSPLASWVGPYITQMLGQGWALSNQPYQAYLGPLTAGATGNQLNAFSGVAGLAVPDVVGQSTTNLQNIGAEMGMLGYNPSQFTSQYAAPSGMYQAGDISYDARDYENLYTSPADMYQAGDITTGQFNQAAAQQYMNPYLQSALNPMMQEARRQSDITRLKDASRLTQAGAYGGSRQAIMESEMNRNLMDKQNQMLTQGYQKAFDTALTGFQTDQQRALEAQIAQERARQVQGQQALTDAESFARYGVSAQELGQRDRQSALEAQIAQERAREAQGSQALISAADAARYGLAADELGMKDRQFGAGYGLDALIGQIAAEQAAGNMGLAGLTSQMDIYNQMYDMGAAERGIGQEQIAADYAQFQQERDYPYQQLQFMQSLLQGLPISSRDTVTDQNTLAQILGGAGGLGELFAALFGNQTQAGG